MGGSVEEYKVTQVPGTALDGEEESDAMENGKKNTEEEEKEKVVHCIGPVAIQQL